MEDLGFGSDARRDAAEAGNYPRELIDAAWQEADGIEGNDPELWRKDEFGAWIYRFDYGRHGSNFGWQIASRGRDLRPVHWQNAENQVCSPEEADAADEYDSFDLFS